jgi:outer membrane protein assembly factor BamB
MQHSMAAARASLLNPTLFLSVLGVLAVSISARSEDWPQWRGPRADGTSTETNLPTHWSATQNVKWSVPLPGKGHGSPIVVGQRIFLNTALENENQRALICLDRNDGHILWQREVLTAPLEKKNNLNSYASSTPACDGQRVLVTFLSGKDVIVAAYDLNGSPLWRKSPGHFSSMHGWSCSPMLYEDSIIVNCDHDGPGYIVRLKRDSGEQVWRIERPNHTRSYCNPTIFNVEGVKHMVLSGTKCTTSYDPDTGDLRWLIDGPTEQYVASMVYNQTQNVFCITAGFPEMHTMGISPQGKVLWHHAKAKGLAAYVPSPVAYGNWFFLVTDNGKAVCLDAKTGEPQWSQQLGKHHFPSAVLANGNVYWLSDEGTAYVVRATDKFELIAKNDLGEFSQASPVLSNGQIFLRSDKHLFCIGN